MAPDIKAMPASLTRTTYFAHPQAPEGGERRWRKMTRLSIRRSSPGTSDARKDPTGPAPGSSVLFGLWVPFGVTAIEAEPKAARNSSELAFLEGRPSRPWITATRPKFNVTEVCGAQREPHEGEAPGAAPKKKEDFGTGGIYVTLGLSPPPPPFPGAQARDH